MASKFQFGILTSLGVLLIIYCATSSAVYHNQEYWYGASSDNYHKATNKPYYNPFGYDTCRRGKFRFDWMKDKSSFFCPGDRQTVDGNKYQLKPMYNPRIVWGFYADLGEFPSFVQLELKVKSDYKNFTMCGGSLLNEYLIITAAHCLRNKTAGFAYAGSVHEFKGQRRAVKRACLPQEYNMSGTAAQQHDWAILELHGEFSLTREVQPACVNFDYRLRRDIKCVSVGFGLTEFNDTSPLLKAAVVKQYEPYVDQAGFIWTSEAGDKFVTGEACRGDSGGPLYCFENCSGPPKMYVVGVASFVNGTNGCLDGDPVVFVNTLNHRKVIPPLIEQMMAKREKQTVHRLASSEEMDDTPISNDGIRCVDFHELKEGY